MTEDTALIEKREELKHQLPAGEYKTLIDVMSDGTGRLIQKLTRSAEPPSFWYSWLVITLATGLILFLTSILLGENSKTMPHFFRPEDILLAISTVGLAFAGMIVYNMGKGIRFTIWRDHLLDAIESVADLADLERWWAAYCNVKKPLFSSLVYAILTGFYISLLLSTIRGGFVGFGPTIFTVITQFQFGMLVYYLFLYMTLPARLSHYQFTLYAADPSSSEVIDHLSDMLSNGMYMVAVFAAIVTLFFALFGLLTLPFIALLVLLAWGPLTAVFVINQYALTRIITKAKWKKLNEIQAKIETLEAQEDIPSEKTLAHLTKLMDYHDRIKATRNSALDLRAGLNFLNSLLLPLLAFLLTNLKEILKPFSGG